MDDGQRNKNEKERISRFWVFYIKYFLSNVRYNNSDDNDNAFLDLYLRVDISEEKEEEGHLAALQGGVLIPT